MAAPDLSSDIAQQALEPLTVNTDGQSSTGRSVDDLIKAQLALSAFAAAGNPLGGIRLQRIVPPGAMPGGGRGGCSGFNSLGCC